MRRAQEKVDGRVSRAQRLREERRAAVLTVARQIFSSKGYHATSIDDLIEAAGIARGTFYLYFESKRAIFDELLDNLLETLRSVVHRIDVSPGAPPPIEQMNATVDVVLETLVANRELARIVLREAVGIDADFDRKLGDFWSILRGMIERAIETGVKMQLVRDCDPEVVAHCILGSLKEVVHWTFIEQTPERVEREPLKKLGRELIAFALKGVFR